MALFDFIIWSVNPEIFPNLDWGIIGNIRWYGLLFALAFIVGQQIMIYIFKVEDKPERDIESLTIYIVLFTIIGARLGHVFFYEPERFLADPIEIFMIQKGGLASHGAAIGILLGIYIYSNYFIKIGFSKPRFVFKRKKREGQSFLWVVDRIVIVVALGGCFIRTGNFINSEIIGNPTGSSYGVVFARNIIDQFEYYRVVSDVKVEKAGNSTQTEAENPVRIIVDFERGDFQEAQLRAYIENQFKNMLASDTEIGMHVNEPADTPLQYKLAQTRGGIYRATMLTSAVPRHPTQLYEAGTSLIIFFLLLWIWYMMKDRTPKGRLFGIFLILLFGLRFFHEFFKVDQVEFEANIPLNMGQWLSIPLVAAGIVILLRSYRPQQQQTDAELKK